MSKARDLSALLSSDGKVEADDLDVGAIGGRRNLIINGAMQVAQRGTSVTGKTNTAYHCLDRWEGQASGATYSMSQETMSDADRETYGVKHYLRFNPTTGNNNCAVAHKIEAKDAYQTLGKTITVSFLAKGTNPNGGTVDLRLFWTDLTNYGTQINESITLTSSWQEFTYTITTLDDDNSVDVDNASAYLNVAFAQPNADTSTDAWTIDVTKVQLEVGDVATPFEHRSYGEELALCHRYYYDTGDLNNMWGTGGGSGHLMSLNIALPTSMRASPTLTYYSTSGASNKISGRSSTGGQVKDATSDYAQASKEIVMIRSTESSVQNFVIERFVVDAEL